MTKLSLSRFWRNTVGQDLMEYALMTAFVAIAAGAIIPSVVQDIEYILKKFDCTRKGGQFTVGLNRSTLNCVIPPTKEWGQ